MTSHIAMGPADTEIRSLSVDDLELFCEIRSEALRTHPHAFGSPEEDEGGEPMLAAYRRLLDSTVLGSTVLGAFRSGGLIGLAGFYVSHDKRARHRGHIYSVYERESDRGRGIGDGLIKQLLAHAGPQVEQVHLAVLVQATPAIRTYERNGFEIYARDRGAVRIGDTTYDKYLMAKEFAR